jgi:hypothetical protein
MNFQEISANLEVGQSKVYLRLGDDNEFDEEFQVNLSKKCLRVCEQDFVTFQIKPIEKLIPEKQE